MDDRVKRALQQWPNVPTAHGWLRLTRRGIWLLKNEHISNHKLIDFINRNYGQNNAGVWLFQNGPQAVSVELDLLPLCLRLDSAGQLISHTQQIIHQVSQCWLDDQGNVLLQTELGPGCIDDRDLEWVLKLLSCPAEYDLNDQIEQACGNQAHDLHFNYQGHAVAVQWLAHSNIAQHFQIAAENQSQITAG